MALTDNPVDLVVDKNLKVSSSINAALPEEETLLYEIDYDYVDSNPQTSYTIPENVNVVKSYFDIGGEIKQTHYIKVSAGKTYNVPKLVYGKTEYRHLIISDTGIQYNNGTTNARGKYLKISYSASINKETNIYNSDYINDDNYIYYYVSTGATSSSDVTTKHQVTKNTTWQQAIDSGQNYAGISFYNDGYAECRGLGTLDGVMYLNDIIKSNTEYGFHELI